MQQGRWVSYIYRYRNNIRCENAGFIKVQRISNGTSDDVRIQIGLKMFKKHSCMCKAYLICDEKEASRENSDSLKSGTEQWQAEYLTDIYFKAEERDTIMKRVELPWENPLGNGKSIELYDGVLFVCDDGERLTGMWRECEVKPDFIGTERKTEEGSRSNQEIKPNGAGKSNQAFKSERETKRIRKSKEKSDKEPVQNTEEKKTDKEYRQNYAEQEHRDSCMEILKTYPQLPLFADSQFTECVKIEPQDIGKLAMGNWRLGVNSFLSHGYYHYRYLMLGKVKLDDTEHIVIGVPGVFTNKEKYLANMFGFTVFVPVKRTELLTGKFGYWISEVSRV